MSVDESKVCRHFNGITRGSCAIDVPYGYVKSDDDIFRGVQRYPCFGQSTVECACYSPQTAEELAEKEREYQRVSDLINRGLSACCFDANR